MKISTIAVIAQGEMGAGTSGQLVRHGMRVVTNLTGRSARSIALAQGAGMEDLADDRAVIEQADIFLSILPPEQAMALAETMAEHISALGKPLLYVDCNAVAPPTKKQIQAVIETAGARFVDVSILGDPPSVERNPTRYYASGPDAADFAKLADFGLSIQVCGDEVGHAAALKMCFAAMTKTMIAVAAETFIAAKSLGVYDDVVKELANSQKGGFEWASAGVVKMPPKAYRWGYEVEEIGRTFESVGLPGATCVGGAQLFDIIAASPLGKEVMENRTMGTTLESCCEIAADFIAESKKR